MHSFINPGLTMRVHMVLDCKADAWLLNLLSDTATQTSEFASYAR
jgi:hypothetical protein